MAENRVKIVIEIPAAQAVQGVGQIDDALDSLGVSATGTGQKLDAVLTVTTTRGPKAAQGVRQVGDALDAVGATAAAAGQKVDAAMTATTAKTQQATQGLRTLGSDASTSGQKAQASVAGLGDTLTYVRSLAAQMAPVLAAAFGVDQVISFANQVVGAAIAMEQLAATYQAVFKDGSAEQLRYAAGMADAFGKSLLDVAGAYRKFAAASEAVGLSTDNQRRTFEAVTAAITKVGGSSQDVAGALLALEQMLSKGTVQAEEYRQQFAERIPGALKMGADALGVTTAAFQKMMENGEVISNDFIPKLTSQLEKFGDGWQATADTSAANAERLKNSFLELSNSPALTGVVTFVEKIGTAFNKNLTHNLEQFTVTYRALVAEAKGELPSFTALSSSLEGLKQQLDSLDQRKATYVKDLKEQAQGLAEALVKVQTHQVDFGPSGENVEQLRQKLKWFEAQITELTGRTWIVSVIAQVDNSQLVQAKSFIESLIKGTAEYKTRAIDAQQYQLDNAVNLYGKAKAALEKKLTNPDLDMREAQVLSRELAGVNAQLSDASIGYRELAKERKKLGEQHIKDNGAVAQFNETRAGVSESDLSKATQASDAHKLSIARQQDAYAKLQAKLIDLPGYYNEVSRAQEAENTSIEKINKSGERGAKALAAQAVAAERYGEQASAYLDNVTQSLQSMEDTLSGGMNKEADRVDKWFVQAINQAQKAMIGAKGDTGAYVEALQKLREAWPHIKDLAVQKDIVASLKAQAEVLRELAQAQGDPALLTRASDADTTAWTADMAQKITAQAASQSKAIWDAAVAASRAAGADTVAIWQDVADKWTAIDQDRADKMGLLDAASQKKRLESTVTNYERYQGVSDKYWQARKTLLEEELTTVKRVADDETAYRIYAAEQWDAYNKALLERQAAYAGSFAETLEAKWALAYGTYKSEATRTKEAWDRTADGIIKTTDGMIDGVASGAGDMVRSWGQGTASIEDLMRNLKSSVLDIFASMIEEMLRMWLKDFVGGLGGSGGSGAGLLGSLGGSLPAASTASGGSVWDVSRLGSLGDSIGRSAGSSMVDSLAAGSADLGMVIGDAPDIGKSIGKELTKYGDVYNTANQSWTGSGYQSWLQGSFTKAAKEGTESGWKSVFGNVAVGAGIGSLFNSGQSMTGTVGGALGSLAGSGLSSMLGLTGSTLGSLLGPVGGALGGLLGGLLGGSSSVTEKTGSGYKIAINAGTLEMSGVDFYKTTTSGMFGSTSTSHSIVDTGMVDPDVARQINDALDDIAENLKDFAKTLGFSAEVLDSFSFPEMTLTSEQLDVYVRNVGNAMAFTALEAAGLRGAFDAVAKDYEVYSDEFERLSTSFGLVSGYTEAFGYDLSALANITEEKLASLREAASTTAAGTAGATLAMAQSMGATADQMAQLSASATDAGEAVQATDAQLRRIAEADYASQLIEAVGGEDEFKAAMERLVKHTLSTLDQYAENLGYYTDKAAEYIGMLGETGVGLENFWARFDAAMRGPLSADQFEAWNDAAKWVDALDTIQKALDDWAATVRQYNADLDVRALRAQGLDDLADITELLAAQESELAAARAAGYDAATLAKIQETQRLELAQKEAQQGRSYWQAIEELIIRERKASGDPYAEAAETYFKSDWEYRDAAAAGLLSATELVRLAAVQAREVEKLTNEIAATIEANTRAVQSRLLRAMGRGDEADLLDRQTAAERELRAAREGGLYTAQALTDLERAMTLEMTQAAAEHLAALEANTRAVQSRLLRAMGRGDEADLLDRQTAAEHELREAREGSLYTAQALADMERAMTLEMIQAIEEQLAAQREIQAALTVRLLRATGRGDEADAVESLAAAEAGLTQARQDGYSAANLLLLAQVQSAELAQEAVARLSQLRTDWAELSARSYEAAGDSVMAGWTRLLEQQRLERYDAASSGRAQAYMTLLAQVQEAERANAWKKLQEQAWQDHLDELNDTLSDLKDQLSDLVNVFGDAIGSLSDVLDQELTTYRALASDARSARLALDKSINDLATGNDAPVSAAARAQSLRGQIDTAYNTMQSAGHGSARTAAASQLSDLAQQYLSALQSSTGDQDAYMTAYAEIMAKLQEAKAVAGSEESYSLRIADALEAEQSILDMILSELRKEDPNTDKLQALMLASQAIGSDLSGLYADATGAGASWRTTVADLLKAAGYSDADITAALGGPTSSSSFLAQLAQFNSQTMPKYMQQILVLLTQMKNIVGKLNEDPPVVDPGDPGQGNEEEKAWAANLRGAMNAQAYGGRTNWSVDEVLAGLETYVGWGANYGITATTGYATPTDAASQYYHAKTAAWNADSGEQHSWREARAAIDAAYGAGNWAAHWLGYGHAEEIDIPAATDPVLRKTLQYYIKKWTNDPSGASTPLELVQHMATIMGLPYDNSAASLQYIARQHWDRYLADGKPRAPGDIGLVRPYAAGGVVPAGGVALVGERGPELVRLGVTSGVSPYATTLNIFGDVLARVQSVFAVLSGVTAGIPQAVDVLAGIRDDVRDYRAAQADDNLTLAELVAGIRAELGDVRQSVAQDRARSDDVVIVIRDMAGDLREFKTRTREQLADMTSVGRRGTRILEGWEESGTPPVRKTAGAQQ